MAQVQQVAPIWQNFATNPIFAAIAGFSSGSALFAALLHSDSPINIGRRLTAKEAHGPPPMDIDPLPLLSSIPEIESFNKVNVPHNTTYSAAQPAACYGAVTPVLGHHLALPDSSHSAKNIFMLAGGLVMIVGGACALAKLLGLRKANVNRSLSDRDIIAWLQSETDKAKTNMETLGNQLDTARTTANDDRTAKVHAENNLLIAQTALTKSQAQTRTCQKSLSDLEKELVQVRTTKRDAEIELAEVKEKLKKKQDVCDQLGRTAEKHQAALQDLEDTKKQERDAYNKVLEASKAEASNAHHLRVSQEQEAASEKAALKQDLDSYIAALTASKAEASDADHLRVLQEREAAAEKAALEKDRDSYIDALIASKAEASAANHRRLSQEQETASERAALEQDRDSYLQAVATLEAEAKEASKLRTSQEQEAVSEKAALERDRDSYIEALATSKAEAKEANELRMSQQAAEKAAFEEEKSSSIQSNLRLTQHVAVLERAIGSLDKKCSDLQGLADDCRDELSAHTKESQEIIAMMSSLHDTELRDKDATISSLQTQLQGSQNHLATASPDLASEQTRLKSKITSLQQRVAELEGLGSQIDIIEAHKNDLAAKLASLKHDKEQLTNDLHKSGLACEQKDGEIDSLDKKLRETEQSLREKLTELHNAQQQESLALQQIQDTKDSEQTQSVRILQLQGEVQRSSSELASAQGHLNERDTALRTILESEVAKSAELATSQQQKHELETQLSDSQKRLQIELEDLRKQHATHIITIVTDHQNATKAAVEDAVNAALLGEHEKMRSANEEHAAGLENLKSEHDAAIDAAVKAAVENEQKNAQAARENMASDHSSAMEAFKQKADQVKKELVQSHELAIKQTVLRHTTEETDAIKEAHTTISTLESKIQENCDTIASLGSKLEATNHTIASLKSKLEEADAHTTSLETARDDLKTQSEHLKGEKAIAEESLHRLLEQHKGDAKLEIAAKDREIVEVTQKVDELAAKLDEQAQQTQQLEVHLKQKIDELYSQSVSHASEVQRIGDINAQQQVQIQSLQDSAQNEKIELESLAREKEELRIKTESDQAFNDCEIGEVQVIVQELKEMVDRTTTEATILEHKIRDLKQEKDQDSMTQAMELEEQRLLIQSMVDEQENANNPRADRVRVPNGLKWSSASIKDDYKEVVRHGIVQQGLYRSEVLIRLCLPHADPFYSDLPHPIPQPCTIPNDRETHSCDHCHETYGRREFYNHVRMCTFFFTDYAVFCTHCETLFLSNSAFKKHEEVCGKARKSGIAPEILAEQPPVDEFDVLAKNVTQSTSTSSSYQDVAQKKSAALHSIPGDALVRAILPFADRDYAFCALPEPVELGGVLPRGFTGFEFGQKFWCTECKLWYMKSTKWLHLSSCLSFFKGRDGHHAHAICMFCGDIFRDNDGFTKHMELCKMHPSKDLCLFCSELFNVEGDELAEHKPHCHGNPDRVHFDRPVGRDRRKKVAVPELEAAKNLTINTSSTPTVVGPAIERAAFEDDHGQRAPQDDAQLGSQAPAPADELTSIAKNLVSKAEPELESQAHIDAHEGKQRATAQTAPTPIASSSQTPSPSAKTTSGSSEFITVRIGTNRSPQPPFPSTPPSAGAFTPGNQSITSSSVLATPFVPKTASPTPNFLGPQGGLGMSRFSPGYVGSHPAPAMSALDGYSPSPLQSNVQPHGYGYRGPLGYPPQFNPGVPMHLQNDPGFPQHHQNSTSFPQPNFQGPAGFPPHHQTNTGFPLNFQGPAGFSPHMLQNSNFAPHQPNNSGSPSSRFNGSSSRPINTTRGSNSPYKRSFQCDHCHLHLPKAMLLTHIPLCRVWRKTTRDTPPPNSDQAFSPPSDEALPAPAS